MGEKNKTMLGYNVKTKKGLMSLVFAGLGLIVTGVTLAVGAFINSKLQAQFTANTSEYNVTVNVGAALVVTSAFLSVLGITLVAGVVIRALLTSFVPTGGGMAAGGDLSGGGGGGEGMKGELA